MHDEVHMVSGFDASGLECRPSLEVLPVLVLAVAAYEPHVEGVRVADVPQLHVRTDSTGWFPVVFRVRFAGYEPLNLAPVPEAHEHGDGKGHRRRDHRSRKYLHQVPKSSLRWSLVFVSQLQAYRRRGLHPLARRRV